MPVIRLIVFKHCTLLASSITFNSEIISLCSRYTKKGLVYIIITESFSRQPSFYFKCTKSNTRALYNIHLVSLNKYIFLAYFNSL